jgi:hypothetical protein
LQVPLVAPMRLLFVATALIASACSAQRALEATPTPARAPDRFIYVAAGDVPSVCYHDLGAVSFTEPFTDAAMDGDGVQMATRLRALAMEKYPHEADAVINVHTEQNAVGTIVTVNGEVVELHQGHTVECAMRKAPGVMNTAAAIAAGGMIGAVAGGLITGGTGGMMGGGAVGAGSIGTYMAVKEHLETKRQQAHFKSLLDMQQAEIARLLAKRSSLQKCAADEIPFSNCKIDDTIGAASDSAKPADAPSYETEQQQFDLQKQIQEQRAYIQKLRDQVFELQQQLGGYSAKAPQ